MGQIFFFPDSIIYKISDDLKICFQVYFHLLGLIIGLVAEIWCNFNLETEFLILTCN